jgi:hypothetical protein
MAALVAGAMSSIVGAAPALAAPIFELFPNPGVLTTNGTLVTTYQATGLIPGRNYQLSDPIPGCPVNTSFPADANGNFVLALPAGSGCTPGQSIATLSKEFGHGGIVAVALHTVRAPRPTLDHTACSGPRFFAAPGSDTPYPGSKTGYPPALLAHYPALGTTAITGKTLVGECLTPNVSSSSGTYTVTDTACRYNNTPVSTDGMGRFYLVCDSFGPTDVLLQAPSVMTISQNGQVIVTNTETFQ